MFTLNVGLFFLSIPIPGFIPSDRFARTGPLRLSFTDRRNSSLRSSDTTGRAFGNPNRTLVPAPMVFRHKTLHLTAELTGKENTTGNLQQQEDGPSGLFPDRMLFLKSRPGRQFRSPETNKQRNKSTYKFTEPYNISKSYL